MRSDTKNEGKEGSSLFPKDKRLTLLLIIGALAGILLIFTGKGSKSESAVSTQDIDMESIQKAEEYVAILEGRVKGILEGMDGISNVTVVITPESSYETVFAQDGRYDGGSLTEKKYVVMKNGGDEEVIPITLLFPRIRGVAVVCKGGSNPINQAKIIKLLSSLLDVEQNCVYVCG